LTDNISPDTPVYPMAIVRSLTGLTDRMIRYYEQVGLLRPDRSPGGRRLFSAADVEMLLRIKAEMQRGLRTAEIRAKFAQHGERREVIVPSTARHHLPHYAGGEPAMGDVPDVETRKAYMASRGAAPPGPAPHIPRVGSASQPTSRPQQPISQPIAPPPAVLDRVRDRPVVGGGRNKPKNAK
jgi:DNA-binding transcriptional MerR regulator